MALLFNMNRLWERYLLRSLQRRYADLDGWEIAKPPAKPFWISNRLEPDILVRAPGGRRLVIDAKWKRPDGKPAVADLRQLYAYAHYYGAAYAVLCYPHKAGEADAGGPFEKSTDAFPALAGLPALHCATAFLQVSAPEGRALLDCGEIPLLAEWAKHPTG